MTPEEAVEKMYADGLVYPYTGATEWIKGLIDAVAATAKAEAKAEETRRCTDRIRKGAGGTTSPNQRRTLINDILITGGLEAEE